MSTTKQSTHFTFPPEKESNKEFSLNCSGTVLETDHTMDHLRLQNISQVRQYNTYFNLSFSSDYWIQFCAEDAKKPQNFWTTSPLNLRRKKKRKLWFLVGNGHITLSKKKSNFQLYYRLWKLQVQNVITLMLFLISYQQITPSLYCDTYIRVRIILLWVSIPGENETAQMAVILEQLAAPRLQILLFKRYSWNV